MATYTARVLVADGEEGVRSGLFRALLDRGIFCDCSATGGDAIDRLGRTPYVMVILDFSLPSAGAAAVIEAIRALPQDARPMVIATAGVDSLPDSELVQMIYRRPPLVADLVEVIEACIAQVRTAWDAPRSADTARSIKRSGTST